MGVDARLDNRFVSPLVISGKRWVNPNHYLIALQYASPGSAIPDTDAARYIFEAKTNKEISERARQTSATLLRPDWKKVRLAATIIATTEKFRQHPDLAKVLLSTPDEILKTEDGVTGKVLTAIRQVLSSGSCDKSSDRVMSFLQEKHSLNDLLGMRITELKELAKKEGIKGYSKYKSASKRELAERIAKGEKVSAPETKLKVEEEKEKNV